jgi:hypothetical protein
MITKSERTSAAAAVVFVITGQPNNNSEQGAWEGGREGGRKVEAHLQGWCISQVLASHNKSNLATRILSLRQEF